MKFPSLQILQEKTAATVSRFPLAVLAGLVIAFMGIAIIEIQDAQFDSPQIETLAKIIFSSLFVFPLFVTVKLLSEIHKFELRLTTLLNIVVAGLGVLYYLFLLPEFESGNAIRTLVITIIAFLSAIALPLVKEKESLGFWQYLRILIERFALTFLYSLILFLGTALIIFTLNALFNLDIPDKTYPQSWFLIAGAFAPILFLSEMPADLKKLSKDKDFSKIIKTLGQYLLLPLLTIYALILYAYGAKILFTSVWPEGIVSGLIILFALVGIVTLLILDPYKKLKESAWLEKYALGFYVALLPLAIMLFMAISIRLREYGITESRYYVVLLGIWLVVTAVYFLLSRKKDIRFIPLSIIVFLTLSIVGPWNAFSVSENSQVLRLRTILEQNNLLVDNKLAHDYKVETLAPNDQNQISSIIYYLGQTHGYDKITPWFSNTNISATFESKNIWNQREELANILNVDPYGYGYYAEDQNYYSFYVESPGALIVSGYDAVFNVYIYEERSNGLNYNNSSYVFHIEDDTQVVMERDGKAIVTLDLLDHLENLMAKYQSGIVTPAELKFDYEDPSLKASFQFSNLDAYKDETGWRLNGANAAVLVKFK